MGVLERRSKLSATLLTLLVLPVLYVMIARRWPTALAKADAMPVH
jgi:hypothetical protein